MSELLSPAEAAERLRVHPKTLARWAAAGKIPHVTTPGGHHRYRMEDLPDMPTIRRDRLSEALRRRHWTQKNIDRLIEEATS